MNRLVVRRLMPASRERVFAAWTDPEGMREWMCPGSVVSTEATLDVRVGGAFRIVMNNKDSRVEHTGEYKVVDPPSKLVFAWISENTDYQPTLVTVELLDRGKQCELVLTHERFPRPDKVEDHERGWTAIVDRLARRLEVAGMSK
jgi:uncharacterized protein YndB with AHSA1/START domain